MCGRENQRNFGSIIAPLLRAGFCLLLILSSFAVAQDPVKVAPEAYKLEFENDYVKVQRVHYAPHTIIPEHDHTAFGAAYIYLNDAGPIIFKHIGLGYGAVTRPAVKAGSFRLYKAVKETHTVENPGDTTSDFLRVEFKTEPGKTANTLRGKFFRVEAPAGENFQQVQFENEQVRITRLICAAGKICLETANATEPILFVVISPAQFKLTPTKNITMHPGDTHWLAAGKTAPGENTGKDAAELLRFDFKTAPAKISGTEDSHAHPPEKTASSVSNTEASNLLKSGADLERAGKIKAALTATEQAIKSNPQLVQAHINLISLYGRTGQLEKAEKHFQLAAAINPDIPELHFNFGVLRSAQERYNEAAQAFQQALKLNPYYAEAHHNYAVIIEGEGKLDEAATHFRQAIENKAGYRSAHFHLGRILVNQEKFAEAIAQFQKTLTPEDDETPRYLYALGATYIRSGDKIKGVGFLREALKRASALKQQQLVISLEQTLKSLEQDK